MWKYIIIIFSRKSILFVVKKRRREEINVLPHIIFQGGRARASHISDKKRFIISHAGQIETPLYTWERERRERALNPLSDKKSKYILCYTLCAEFMHAPRHREREREANSNYTWIIIIKLIALARQCKIWWWIIIIIFSIAPRGKTLLMLRWRGDKRENIPRNILYDIRVYIRASKYIKEKTSHQHQI